MYCLIGVLALEEIDVQVEGKNWNAKGRAQIVFYIEFISYMEVALGLLYYVLGCLCTQQLKHKVYKDFERRCAVVEAAQKGVPVEAA